MSTTDAATAASRPQPAAPATSENPDAHEAVEPGWGASLAPASPSAAAVSEVVLVSLADVRRVGADTAVVWATIQSGRHGYGDLVAATRMPRREVRAHWARLARYGYPLPENTPTAAAASAAVGASTHH